MLLSAYRKDDLADPEVFVAQLGIVLEGYDDAVIIAVTDPRTGLQRRAKWMPTISEVVDACEAEASRIATQRRYAAMPKPAPSCLTGPVDNTPGRRAQVFVHADAPQYQRCVDLAGTADQLDWKWDENGRAGIWVALSLFESQRPTQKMKRWVAPTDDELRAIYAKQKLQEEAAE